MNASFDAVCFDLDGTLIDSGDGVSWALTQAVAEVLPGVVLPPVIPLIGPPVPVMLQTLLPEHGNAHGAIADAFKRYYDEHGGWERTTVYPGVPEALGALAAGGLRLDIVTNKRSLPTARILDRFGLAGRFAAVVSPDSARPPSATKAEALATLLRETGIPPERVAYVGDTDADRTAAQHTGCSFVWVEWGFGGAGAPPVRHDLASVTRAEQLPLVLLPPRHVL